MLHRSEQIAAELESAIRSGKLTGKLPSEKDLARQFSTAGMTLSRAMNLLKSRGLVRQVHRRGTFAIKPETRELRFWGRGYFACMHPELLIAGIPDVKLVEAESPSEADLAVFATTMPMNYSSNFLPWPSAKIEELRSSDIQ